MRGSISLFMLIVVVCTSFTGALALDKTKYPDWKGQRVRAGGAEAAPWDARKPDARKLWGLGQQPPLTPEYQALFEADLKQLAAGVKASDATARCIPVAMPRVMMAIHAMEIVILPDTTFDNALPWPWTQSYRRAAAAQPVWTERACSEDGHTIRIGEEGYGLGSDGLLMPVRKPPPDLRLFQ